jgi:arylsulfatase A-like enzyme
MHRHRFLWPTAIVCSLVLPLGITGTGRAVDVSSPSAGTPGPTSPPNIVLVFTDDQGYADVGCFGARDFQTPNLDRMAAEGTRFTSFCVAQAVCTASRAALMTGCYANRVSMSGALNHTSRTGIHPDEVLLPEICKSRGYATAIFGKWHLGTLAEFGPLRNGFDEYLGIPYSNDNSKYHPIVRDMPPLPLCDGEKVVETDPDQSQFTRRFTERAVRFIEANRSRPFFLYVPHVMPHVPIFASEKFLGRSRRGLYGDVIEEIDWSVGEILAAIRTHGLDEKTLVIFASDNGPFLSYGDHAGSAAPLREGKLTTFEGGVRTPCIMRWPGKIPAGRVCDDLISSIDLLPTIARLIGADPPAKQIDGKDVWPLLSGREGATTPHEAFYYYAAEELQAVRSEQWKLHFPHEYLSVAGPPGRDGKPANFENLKPKSIQQSGIQGIASRHGYEVRRIELSLYDLAADPGETRNLAGEHPEMVKRLSKLAEAARADLGDALTGREGSGVRPAGMR